MPYIALLLLISAYFFAPMEAREVKTIETFSNPEKGYSIQYPADWSKNTTLEGFDLFIMAPNEADGHSHANFSIIASEQPKDVDLQVFTQQNISNLLQGDTSIDILGAGKTTINDIPANWFWYTKGNDNTEIVHYFMVANGQVILLTEGARLGDYDKYKTVLEKITNDFTMNASAH